MVPLSKRQISFCYWKGICLVCTFETRGPGSKLGSVTLSLWCLEPIERHMIWEGCHSDGLDPFGFDPFMKHEPTEKAGCWDESLGWTNCWVHLLHEIHDVAGLAGAQKKQQRAYEVYDLVEFRSTTASSSNPLPWSSSTNRDTPTDDEFTFWVRGSRHPLEAGSKSRRAAGPVSSLLLHRLCSWSGQSCSAPQTGIYFEGAVCDWLAWNPASLLSFALCFSGARKTSSSMPSPGS